MRALASRPKADRAAPVPYYLVDVAELPYPHAMGTRPRIEGARVRESNCPLALSTLRRTLGLPSTWSPGQDGYRELFTANAVDNRRQSCDVHQGDWAVVLPAVTAFLEPFPATADTAFISRAAREDSRLHNLARADRRLALALLSYSDSLRVYTTAQGHQEANGQHRICWARTAGVAFLPLWYDDHAPRPPRTAVLLQRG